MDAGDRAAADAGAGLVGGAGRRDVEEVAGLDDLGVVLGGRVEDDDVVELEALDLPYVGDVDAGGEAEVLAADAAELAPRASMIAAPRLATVGMKSFSIQAWSPTA